VNPVRLMLAGACLFAGASVVAKPIAFAHGTTVMAEYGAEGSKEVQVFHAPEYFWSLGVGYLALDGGTHGEPRDYTYARANYLVKRWNREAAQANIFVWGGAGSAALGLLDERFAWNAGMQFDYETRRIYASLKTDVHRTSISTDRMDTLQLGVAPYEHEYDGLATWLVAQGRVHTDDHHVGTEWSLLLRLFKRGAWIEAGVTDDGKLQAMAMVNF
jgi:hypothetical protein